MTLGRRPRLALVVPSLSREGGVAATARFIKDVVLRSGGFDLQLVSLSESANVHQSLRLANPWSWLNCPTVATGEWEGLPFVHVGAMVGEFEFQRYRPRAVLTSALAGCDVVQVVSGSPAWANSVLGLGKPVSLHVATRARIERRQRDASPRSPSALWRRAMTFVTDKLDDRALRGVQAIQAMNPTLLDYARNLNAGRVVDMRHLPPGINADRYRPVESRQTFRDSYILCVARLGDPRKKIGLLLDAYALMPHVFRSRTKLVLAGASAPPQSFWRRADALGLRDRVQYVERPDERALLHLYQNASLFALSSDEEGFGLVLLEAMACGVPVVSTRSGGPDAIITDGLDGYLVPLDDVEALSGRMTVLLSEPLRNVEMGRQARLTVERRYDEHVAGEAFVDIWDRLAHQGGAG